MLNLPTLVQTLSLTFVPLFVAIDPPMAIPMFVVMTEGAPAKRKIRLANEAVLAALLVALLFLLAGNPFFKLIGITESDFKVSGGIVLLALSVSTLVLPSKSGSDSSKVLSGAVPLGVPLIMGPAAITTIILSVHSSGYYFTFVAILSNLVLVWLMLRYSHRLVRLISLDKIEVISKIAYLILGAMAVMMIRTGLKGL
jgi:multiple antibiotic resistance protein